MFNISLKIIIDYVGKAKPGIWLVQGHTTCTGLSGQVTARQLAEVTAPGTDRRRIPGLAWDDFRDSCVIVLQAEDAGRRGQITTEAAATLATATLDTNNITPKTEDNAVTTTTEVTTTSAEPATRNSSAVVVMPPAAAGTLNEGRGQRMGRAVGRRILRLVPTARFFLPLDLAAFVVLSAGAAGRLLCPYARHNRAKMASGVLFAWTRF